MGLVKQHRNGITYLYESESYYDPEKKQSRSKRKLLGKIDPVTGELVPTGKKGRPKKEKAAEEDKESRPGATEAEKALSRELREKDKEIERLKRRIETLEEENGNLRSASDEAGEQQATMNEQLSGIIGEFRSLTERAGDILKRK